MLTVDIDVGGTLTDGLVRGPDKMVEVKVDTTPHDLTVCFLECLQEAADQAGYPDLESFLREVTVLRWSSTITTNVLAERKGPKVGLVVTEGYQDSLYGDGESLLINDLVARNDIYGLPVKFDDEDVLTILRKLLEGGVRRVCVSLKDAFSDDTLERKVRRLIQEQYPDQYVGAVPVMLGSEGCRHPDDRTRTHYALLSAYVHDPLATSLFKAEDVLKDKYKFKGHLLIGNIDGGVARVAKTKALETLEVGPIFGIHGAAYWARKYNQDYVISLDVGGTTAKVGAIQHGRPVVVPETEILGVSLKWPSVFLRSVSIGGGTVASAAGTELKVGPESMGAYPGPACYGFGGENATITDAFVTLGLLNPENFLGGRRLLDVEKAKEAIQNNVAGPLRLEIKDAAWQIKEKAEQVVAAVVRHALDELGWHEQNVALFAFGGNGPLFAPGVAEKAGISNITVFNFGAVFSAFGSSIADICHNYQYGVFAAVSDTRLLEEAVDKMMAEARRDMRGEGFTGTEIKWTIEIDFLIDGSPTKEELFVEERDSGGVPAEIKNWLGKVLASKPAKSTVQWIRVRALYPVAKYEVSERVTPKEERSPVKAVGQREVLWKGRTRPFAIYGWQELVPGSKISEAALLESARTTYLVPPGWSFRMDGFGNGQLASHEG